MSEKPYDIGVNRHSERPIFLSQATSLSRVTMWLDVPLAEGLIVDLRAAIKRVKNPPEDK